MSDPRNFLSPQQEIDTKNTVSDSVVAGEPIETVSSIWGRVSAAMKQDLGDTKWQAWIKNLTPVTLSEKGLVLQAGNSFIRDRVQSQYAEKLRFMLKREYGAVQQVSVTVGSAHPAPLAAPAPMQSAPMQSASVKSAPLSTTLITDARDRCASITKRS